MVFNPDGTPYFSTVYDLSQEQTHWSNKGYTVKSVCYETVSGDIKLTIPEEVKP